ncbi:hypothetical protein G4228_012019 [Cervus hanglu yarkandensis]|nr:hypothetical protein G4228_012019 [Cervus hanglu yarkandensis]
MPLHMSFVYGDLSSLLAVGLGQLTLEQPEVSVTGTREKSVIMSCKVFSKDFSKDYIHWYRQKPDQGLEQLLYVLTTPALSHSGGTKNKLEAKKDVSSSTSTLRISFLQKEDEAMYYCAGWVSAHNRDLDIDMSPKPTMFLPSITEIKHDKTGTYLCLLEKFFPHVIKVYWREKSGNRVLPSQQGNTMKTDDTYMKFSWLTVSGNSMDKEHMCIVKHEKNKRDRNQEILFPSVNEVASSVVTTTKPPNDGLKDKSEKQTPAGNSTKACLKDENITPVSSNAKGAQMSVTSKTWETASFTCDLTQDATYIHLYKQQEGTAPRRLFYYDVYYSKIEFESGTNKAKYSVYKSSGRSYRFAILNLEYSDSGMYYCAVWDKHVDRNLATDISPKPTIFLPSIAEINHSKTGTYLCLLEKFFPDIIEVYWKEKDGNRALPSQKGNTMKTTDTYMKFSWLTVAENSMDKEHICVVKHERNIGGTNQEILFRSINEVVSSIIPTTESPSDCLNHESEVTGTGSKKVCLKDESEVTADHNSTKVCLKDESKMLSLIQLSGTVAVITSDGRMIVGTLKGFDQTINLILDESHERVFSSSQGVEQVVLGLYIVRGDNVAVIGEIDEETDSALDLGNIRAEPLNSVAH